jgi:alpha-amylase
MFLVWLLVVCSLLAAVAESALELNSTSTNSWVIYQSFDWSSLSNRGNVYSALSSGASSLSSAGINAVWFPPPSQSVDTQGYLPQQWYSLVYESNLKSAISAVSDRGMAALADVVVNHRTAPSVDSCTEKYTKFSNPDMGNWAVTKDDENCGSKASTCGCGNYDTGDVVTYAPDLDHTSTSVQSLVKEYLAFLKGYGFSGWRIGV